MHNPGFRALYLRREAVYLGDAVDKSSALYPKLGATLRQSPRIEWRFPSGATVWFSHCAHEADVRNFDGFEFALVLFDELTHFTLRQYTGIRARLRGTDPTLPYASRAATNPGGEGQEWVFGRWRAWLDPTHPQPAAPGEPRWYVGDDEVPRGAPDAEARTFIPARLADNPHIPADYRAKLAQLDPVRRAQLERGDWLAKAAPRAYWDRTRVTHVDAAPAHVTRRGRFWDFGATATGDYTVGARMSVTAQGVVCVEHVARFRGPPAHVHAEFARIAREDQRADPRCEQWIPEDPGQAGKDQVRIYQVNNPGVAIRARRPTGDKLTRFGPASARAAAGTLVVVRGSWNKELHDELESVPEQSHDDQMDCVSDGVAVLTQAPSVRIL